MRTSRSRVMPILAAGTFTMLVCAHAAAAQTAKPSPPSGPQQREPPAKPTVAPPADQMGRGAMSTAREGSGTAWLPDASPMYGIHRQQGQWQFIAHGNGFLQYLNEGNDRGSDQFGSINWVMGMAQRNLGSGRLALRGMVSFEPVTIGGCGYPDLLATGEVCEGDKIHDQQHQHDLFMEVAATYDAPLGRGLRWQVYGGPAGEPALGPVAFPHRISAMPNLLAPIAHHWLDATHITFGVVTAGVYGTRWKAEASAFNGREPDEHRTGFDLAPLDSVSGRVWYLPTSSLALQVSAGRLNEAEPGEDGAPRVDATRLTASATYHRLRAENGTWANTIAWGRNSESGQATNAFLLETSVTLRDRDAWFGRFEIVEKTAHDLDVPGDHHAEGEPVFTVGKLQAGYTRYFDAWQNLKPGIGFTASLSFVPRALEPFYGDRVNPGVGIYLTVRPAAMRTTVTQQAFAGPGAVPGHQHAAPTPAAEVSAPAISHEHPVPPPAAQKPLPATPVKPQTPADPHAGHTPPTAIAPAAKPGAKPADPKAPAKPAAGHAGHTTTSKPAARPAPKPADRRAERTAPAAASKIADDPKKLVCSPPIDPDSAPSTTYKGKTYYFCTAADRLRFIKNPETYLRSARVK